MRGLLIAALFGVAALYAASQVQAVAPWARNICGYVGEACDKPQWLMIATAVLILLYVLVRK
jgi:H+/Cl- antiporter ClcA